MHVSRLTLGKKILFCLAFSFLCLQVTPAYAITADEGEKVDNGYSDLAKQLKPPQPAIRIPGVTFSDVAKTLDDDGNISTPFIGEYISGVYKFAMVAASVIAVIMIIVQGVQVIMSGGGEEQVNAYKNIARIFVGLFLVWGSYFILYTINPELVNFKILKIKYIVPEELPTLGSTIENTAGDDPALGAANNTAGTGAPSVGTHKQFVTSCPITLTSTVGNASKIEFRQKMSPFVTGNTPRERTVQIADIADACNVNWGSCGDVAGTISALAGVGDTSCLDSDGKCNSFGKGSTIFAISREQRNQMIGWNCNINPKEGKVRPAGECEPTAQGAVKKYRDYLLKEKAEGRIPATWPDGIANKLQPGDRLVVYNGNKDPLGAHGVIFVGWSGDKIQVIQGGAGGSGAESGRARAGTICIKSTCGENMIPLLYAWAASK